MLALLVVPFFQFAQSELAPKEDQGVVFGILIPSPTSTIDQNMIFADEVQKVFTSVPEYETSFQLTGANFGFSGVLLKPWSERKRTSMAIEASLQGPAASTWASRWWSPPRSHRPPAASTSIELVLRSTADHRELFEYAEQLLVYANTEANDPNAAPTFYFADSDLKFDLPQVEIDIDKDKVASMGST